MSDKWPGHHPPPYYGGYPPPPPPVPVAYMPAPVMMPMPMPMPSYQHRPPAPEPAQQPTYITNYYYPQQPPPDPVQVVEQAAPPAPIVDPIDWVPATPHTASSLQHRAVVAGKEGWDSSPLWVIRSHHSGDLVPGKLAIKHRHASIPYAGKETPVHNFEVLCAPTNMVRWLPASNGQVPSGAIIGGNTHSGEPLYVARVRYKRSITPGKVHPSHGCMYIGFDNKEISHKSYEVLCRTLG